MVSVPLFLTRRPITSHRQWSSWKLSQFSCETIYLPCKVVFISNRFSILSYLTCKKMKPPLPNYSFLFRCVLTSLLEGVSVRPSVRPSIGPSVHRSVRPLVRRSHSSWISEKLAEFEQNSIRNKKVCHLKDDSKTSTRAVSQNASVVRTLFDLFGHNR